ncbi:hypothetical protein Pcinc_011619 [Petrolisthes cinctipes]|uniref:Protein FRA10AC1 n=1 Tax=Petrolisthes cinctipes TaxID=88211 RepID=A0AAE1G0H0_PETCI|nr:hypothetical protein Pcinc_011619 [Petrolisthes cinctipes]
MALKNSATGYDSAFEEDEKLRQRQQERHSLFNRVRQYQPGLPSRSVLADEASREEGRRLRYQMSNLTAFERHKLLINQYVLYHPGSTAVLQRDTSKDKRDIDVVRENHQFLWDMSDQVDTWEKQLARRYYDKLFREYCICDLSHYKENKVGMRWRVEQEVVSGKGQFSCGEKRCGEREGLRTWEMNFAYVEQGTKKNALVKLRLCHDCSYKVNYHHKRKELTKRPGKSKNKSRGKEKKKSKKEDKEEKGRTEDEDINKDEDGESKEEEAANIWKGPAKLTDEKNREEEFEEYLEDLFL